MRTPTLPPGIQQAGPPARLNNRVTTTLQSSRAWPRSRKAAAARGVVGNRTAARAPGGSADRPQVPAHGWRLRRDLRGVRVRQDRQEAQDPAADEPRAVARTQETHHSRRPHGWAVRQAAIGRHRNPQRRHARPRSVAISRTFEFTAEAREPDPTLLLRGYERGAHAEFRARVV